MMSRVLSDIADVVLGSYEHGRLELCDFKLKESLAELRKDLGTRPERFFDLTEYWIDNFAKNTIKLHEGNPLKKSPRVIARLLFLSPILDQFAYEFIRLYVKKSPAQLDPGTQSPAARPKKRKTRTK